jgi:hypothetical protein
MPTPDVNGFPDAQQTTTITTVGLGLAGGVLSLIFGGNQLTLVEKIGCIACGGLVAYIACPLISLFYPEAPHQLYGVTGFFSGLIGLNVVRGILVWSNRNERRIPEMLDKRVGMDSQKPGEEKK